MIKILNNINLAQYLLNQLNSIFPDNQKISNLENVVAHAILKIEYNFEHIALPYYSKNNKVFFNHLNADHYTVFIYYCSNIAYNNGDITLASKLFYLNKVLHSFHCMYDTELPNIFLVTHGVGVVLGKASYSNYLVFTQGCTVGANGDWEYPDISSFVIMYPNSSILGNSVIKSRVILANNTVLLNEKVPDNSLVVGSHPNIKIKEIKKNRFSQFFKI